MGKNYLYILALGAVISVMTFTFQNYVVVSLYIIWLVYLIVTKKIPNIVLILSILSFVFFYYYIPDPNSFISPESYKERTLFTGSIVSSVTRSDKKIEFTFKDEGIKDKILVLYFKNENELVEQTISNLQYGASCRIEGTISIPDNARNPHQFDYRLFLQKKGIPHQIIIPSLDQIQCEMNKSFMQYIYLLRANLLHITSEKLHPETASWLHALVLGNDDLIHDDTIELFQRWSLSHILAISGLHIGIVVGILYLFLVRMQITTKEKAQWIIIILLPIYAIIAGGQPSVWRASLMILLVILLSKIKIKLSYTDIISVVFLCLLAMDKYIVYQIGFQFSFVVTFGIILSNKWISQSKTNVERIFQISFISQMMILPLQVYYFFTFQPLSILLNILIVPYFSLFVIPSLFILLLFIMLPTFILRVFEIIFLNVHSIILDFIVLVDTYCDFPFIIGEFPLYFMFFYYVILVWMMIYLERRELIKSFRLGMTLTLFLVFIMIRPYFSPIGTVTMLDMGQGDTYVIELPYRRGVFFIDAGATFSFPNFEPSDKVYKQIIKPYLYGRGISSIDTIFISHDHYDHHGSAPLMIEEMNVAEVIIGMYHPIDEKIEKEWEKEKVIISRAKINDKIIRKGQGFHVLSPEKDKKDENENSVVLYTELGGLRWLFTGDIGKETEREMIKNFKHLSVDVLKVGHHGSNTSTDPLFIQEVNPSVALISAGINNSYGHPAKEVLQTLVDEDIIIYRSDIDGAVQYQFKETKGRFKKYIETE